MKVAILITAILTEMFILAACAVGTAQPVIEETLDPVALPTAAPEQEAAGDSEASPTVVADAARQDGASATFDPAALNGPFEAGWLWQSYADASGESIAIEASQSYALNFADESTLLVTSGCNFVFWSYALTGDGLSVEPTDEELADCGEGSRSRQFLDLVAAATSVAIDDNKLAVTTEDGVLTFSAYDPFAAFRVDSWDEAAQEFLEACGAPGAVLLVDGPKGRFLQAYGLSSLEDETPMQVDHRFEIGSNSKSFTAILALQLQEEGVWSLNDPLSQWLPDVAMALPYGDQITLRQLASNTSGVWDYANPLIGAAIEENNLEQGYTPQELIDYAAANGEPDFAPGEGGAYSSTNFIVLGMALEAATGKPIAELYRERIFEPLGMESSFLLEGVPADGDIVNGYYGDATSGVINTTAWNASQGWAAGGIVSTAEDMARFAKALDAGALFQDETSTVELTDFQAPVLPFAAYGLGVGKWSDDPLAWGHGGQTAGFGTLYAIYPQHQTVVVMLTNSASCPVQSFLSYPQTSPMLFDTTDATGESSDGTAEVGDTSTMFTEEQIATLTAYQPS